MLGNSKKAGGGAVIRCSNGDWIAGCLRKLGNPSCILAELWALRDGLLLAKQISLYNICVDMDLEYLVYYKTCGLYNLELRIESQNHKK